MLLSCQEKFVYEYSPKPNPILEVDMVQYFEANPEFYSILTSAIKKAGLENVLSTETLTFFAPDNRAWNRYFSTSSTHKTINDFSPEELKNLLSRHMIEGKYLVFDFSELPQQYTPLFGNDLTINYNNVPMTNRYYRIFVNGLQVKVSNLEPTNGAIHVLYDGLIK